MSTTNIKQFRTTMTVLSPPIPDCLKILTPGASYASIKRFVFKTRNPGVKFFFQLTDEEIQAGEGPISWNDSRLIMMTYVGVEELHENTFCGSESPSYVTPIADQSLRLYLYAEKKCAVSILFEVT